jgi:hypothetical protein
MVLVAATQLVHDRNHRALALTRRANQTGFASIHDAVTAGALTQAEADAVSNGSASTDPWRQGAAPAGRCRIITWDDFTAITVRPGGS